MENITFGKEEFGTVDTGDKRLDERLKKMADSAMKSPQSGFPKMMKTDAELEATYRFFNNPKITPQKILEPHYRCTVERATRHSRVLVAHDTSVFQFGGESQREGLGKIKGQRQGFSGHVSLALAPGEKREALGLLSVELINDTGKIGLRSPKTRREDPNRQSMRWEKGIEESERRLGGSCEVIHVMDRECDSYALWAWAVERSFRFVTRLAYNRKIAGSNGEIEKIFDVLEANVDEPWVLERDVRLSHRGKSRSNREKKVHPPRKTRVSTLGIRAMQIEFKRTHYTGKRYPEFLTLNVVHVKELNPPEGVSPVEWRLVTTERIDSVEDIAEIVDVYRSRWVIEEYFKSLKTGCSFEKRQLESYQALTISLALLAPIAWRLLCLRNLSRDARGRPAQHVLNATQLQILRKVARDPFPDEPNIYDAMFAIARLGGFLKHNKSPGWQTLGQGLNDLLLMEIGWENHERCDQ